MIYINNLYKDFNGLILYEDLNLTFEDRGLYGLIGPSGKGKSTLLNMIASFDNNYSGRITIDEHDLKTMSESQRRDYRLKNFGFIFQNYSLLNEETVINNIKIIQDSFSTLTKEIKTQNLEIILQRLGIYEIKDEFVKNLSGGEKQRVAIARAIINQPKVIFCDEPTGSLDEKNKHEIFDILRDFAKDRLVIVVSHDVELVEKYANYIFDLSTMEMKENKKITDDKSSITIIGREESKKRGRISLGFIFRNIKSAFQLNKVRYIVSGAVFSIALICLGLTIFISDNVSSSINKAFGAIISENTLVLQKKNSYSDIVSYSASKDDVVGIMNNYPEEVDYVGAKYLVNFPSFFVDQDSVYFLRGGFTIMNISFLSSTSFNEFQYLDETTRLTETFYPSTAAQYDLADDEIILGIDYLSMENLCYDLQILRSYDNLGDYIQTNGLNIILSVANYNWAYEDEQIFSVKGVFASTTNRIYHTDMFFNVTVFEENMMLPSTNNMFEESYYPWVMKKVYYFKSTKFQTNIINTLSKDERYENFIFDVDNSTYSPSFCTDGELCYSNRVFVFRTLNDLFSQTIIDDINSLYDGFEDYYYSTYYGYINLGASLFNGFANTMYFAASEQTLNSVESSLESILVDDENNLVLPSNVASGHYLDTNADSVKFSIKFDGKYAGSAGFLYNSVGISTALADKLYGDVDPLGQDIYLMLNTEKRTDGYTNWNTFKKVKLTVSAVVDSSKYQIYQEKEFSISLFRDFFEISSFYLIPHAVVFEFDSGEKPSESVIEEINQNFPEYELVDPYSPIDESINEVFSYLNLGLLVFTCFAFVSSSILLFVINTINFEEEKKTLAIFAALGFSNGEICKLETLKTFSYLIPSIISAALCLSVVSYFLGKIIAQILGLSLSYTFPLVSIIGVIGLSILMAFASFIFIIYTLNKKNLLDELH